MPARAQRTLRHPPEPRNHITRLRVGRQPIDEGHALGVCPDFRGRADKDFRFNDRMHIESIRHSRMVDNRDLDLDYFGVADIAYINSHFLLKRS